MEARRIKISLPDGTTHELLRGMRGDALAQTLYGKRAERVLAMQVDGVVCDLATPLMGDARLRFLTWEDPEGKMTFWHSSAHLLAEALMLLYPQAKLGIGPPIKQGFYYDVDFGACAFEEVHLEQVEAKVRELLKQRRSFQRMEVRKEEAAARFGDNPYKLELLASLADEEVSLYGHGDFVDLCKGPHLPDTTSIKAFKLLGISRAYWRGDAQRKQLTRIYGISFPRSDLLTDHLKRMEALRQYDHRKLGQAMGLFTFSEAVGQGLPLWLPKGALLRDRLVRFLHEAQLKVGYQPVVTPHIGLKQLYVTSGHYAQYREGTFQAVASPTGQEEFLLKPMNCPHHCVLYAAAPRSYRALPLRFAEFGMVYRYEQSGALHGLTRVRGFTQDDAHVFCRPDQLKEELARMVDFVSAVLACFALPACRVRLSSRDARRKAHYIGSDALWEDAEQALMDVVAAKGIKAEVVPGEAAFYAPKLDFVVEDAWGRPLQLGTVQVDFQLPLRFGLSYVGRDNRKETPVMIHRAALGSLDRFIGLFIEHTRGRLPLWLSPEQAVVLPISAVAFPYARQVVAALQQHAFRATVDLRDEKIHRKVRDAEVAKIPYLVVVGRQEEQQGQVRVREMGGKDRGAMTVAAFAAMVGPQLVPPTL